MHPVVIAFAIVTALPLLRGVYKYLNWIYRIWFVIGKAVNQFPGEPIKWPYGNLHLVPDFNEELVPFQKKLVAKYNRIFRFWMGPFVASVVLVHPDTIKILVKTEEPKFTDGIGAYTLAEPWLGDGLLLSKGKKWKRNRRLLTPAFHFDILKSYISVYNEETEILMDKWTEKSENGESFDIQADVGLCTLGIILRCAFSYDEKIQQASERPQYAVSVLELARLLVQRVINPVYRLSDFIYKLTSNGRKFYQHCDFVHQKAEDVIAQRRKALRDDPHALENKKYLDFLDILLQAKDEDGSGLTDLEIRNEVDTFLFEGHDTTASSVSWALYSLAKYPEFQKKAQHEIDELLADRSSKRITWEDMSQLPYLTQCIKESMRLWAPVPMITRQLTKPLTIEGVTLPPNTLVSINILMLHHNPSVWGDDHDEFKPDRFLHENISKMDNFAFLPFSAGPRNCIGQNFALDEQKVAIARILQRFDLSVDESHPVLPRPEVVTRAMHGIKLFVKPRT